MLVINANRKQHTMETNYTLTIFFYISLKYIFFSNTELANCKGACMKSTQIIMFPFYYSEILLVGVV